MEKSEKVGDFVLCLHQYSFKTKIMRITHELLEEPTHGFDSLLRIEGEGKNIGYPTTFEFIRRENGDLAWIEMGLETFVNMMIDFHTLSLLTIELALNAQFKNFESTTFRIRTIKTTLD